MASTTGHTFDAIEREVLTSPSNFTFERLLTNLHAIVVAQGQDPLKKIRVRPALSFQLNRSEIVSVTKNNTGEYEVLTNFLGLYGASSPLPSFYTEQLMTYEQEEQTTPRKFLDIIHQRLYQLYSKAQRKYDVISQVVEYQQRGFTQLVHNVIGTGDDEVQSQYLLPDHLLKYAGLLATKQRSATGLKKLLEAYLSSLNVEVKVQQFVSRRVTVPKQHLSALGVKSCELGSSALIGDQLIDHNSKIVIHLGPITQLTFDQLVNDKLRWRAVEQLIKTYIDKPLEVDIKVSLITQTAKGIELGTKQWCQLGYDTWLLAPAVDKESSSKEDILVTTLRLA
jgi:type VI secretion system protein ImpH